MATRDEFWPTLAPPGVTFSAYCLGVLARIAYTGAQEPLEAWADSFGFREYAVIETPGVILPNLMIVGEAHRLIVAIPGTVNPQQMFNNILYSAQRENADFGSGRIHSFFLWCAEGIVNFIRDSIGLFPLLRELTFVGHSLGGAVAQILADWVEKDGRFQVKLCCTFNSPRVGSQLWAQRSRSYPTNLYYNRHDMVCELPPSLMYSVSTDVKAMGFMEDYWHRDTLVPVQSGANINASWAAILPEKILEAPNIVSMWADRFHEPFMSQLFHRSIRIARIAALGSWVLPLPVWFREHWMDTVLDNLEAMPGYGRGPEMSSMLTIRSAIPGGVSSWNTLARRDYRLVDYGNFAAGEYPGGGGLADLPTVPAGTRFEMIESDMEWFMTPNRGPSPDLISVDQLFFDAVSSQAASTGQNPFQTNTPLPLSLPKRPNWAFRSTDRAMIEELYSVLSAIQARDLKALIAGPSEALSTRDPIIDEDLIDALELLIDRARACLGQFYPG